MSNFNYMNEIARMNAQAAQPVDTTGIMNLSTAISSGFKAGQDIAQTMRENDLWADTANLKKLENDKRREYLNAAETPEQIGNYFGFKQPTSIQSNSIQNQTNQSSGGTTSSPQRMTALERERMRLKEAGMNDMEIAAMLYPEGTRLVNESRLYRGMAPYGSYNTSINNDNSTLAAGQSMGLGTTTPQMNSSVAGLTMPTTPSTPLNVTPVDMPYGYGLNQTDTTTAAEKDLLSVAFDNSLTPDQRQARLLSIGQSSDNNTSIWPYSMV